jgi:phasin family protein
MHAACSASEIAHLVFERLALNPLISPETKMLTPEQLIATQKSQLEAMFALGGKALESLEKVADLNIQTLKTALNETSEAALAALSVKDVQELTSLQPSLAQPLAEKFASYSQHLYEIASSAQAEFAKAFEDNAAEAHKKVQALVDTAVKNAPAGSEAAVALVKSALTAANTAYDSVQKAGKQAAEVVESNIKNVANSAIKASQNGSRAKRTAA